MTHIIHSRDKKDKPIFFCGTYKDVGIGDNGKPLVDIIWKWTYNIDEAYLFCTTDAWDLYHIGLEERMVIYVQRRETYT